MKTILLYVGAVLFLSSCDDPSNTHASESLTDNEMKSQVEVEEIHFEKEKGETLDAHEKKGVKKKILFNSSIYLNLVTVIHCQTTRNRLQ